MDAFGNENGNCDSCNAVNGTYTIDLEEGFGCTVVPLLDSVLGDANWCDNFPNFITFWNAVEIRVQCAAGNKLRIRVRVGFDASPTLYRDGFLSIQEDVPKNGDSCAGTYQIRPISGDNSALGDGSFNCDIVHYSFGVVTHEAVWTVTLS